MNMSDLSKPRPRTCGQIAVTVTVDPAIALRRDVKQLMEGLLDALRTLSSFNQSGRCTSDTPLVTAQVDFGQADLIGLAAVAFSDALDSAFTVERLARQEPRLPRGV